MSEQPPPWLPAVQEPGADVRRPAPAGAGPPVGAAPRWGVSSLDWRSHAIDEDAEHPEGVYVARCGQRLVTGTSLYDEAPGWMCLDCLR
ncbi:MAG: hypothetical protein ACRDRW_15750 [Pseudonocardiaceae bacterium]